MDYKKKQKELTEQFEVIQKEIQQLQQTLSDKQQLLLKIQGKYELLEELIKVKK